MSVEIKVAFVDLPQVMNATVRPDFYELFHKLREEYDFVYTFAKIPEGDDGWGMLRVVANAGAFPVLCPGDPDPIIAEEIRRTIEQFKVKEICLLSGDNGFFKVLETAKKKGVRIKIILPFNNRSRLLMLIADEADPIEKYAKPFVNHESARANHSEIIIPEAQEL